MNAAEFDEVESNLETVAVVKAPKKKAKPQTEFERISAEPRVRIILEENDQIPPTGQFVGVNGVGYLVQPGVAVDVPESVLDVLDNAIMSVPVKDANDAVIGYRDRLRFPYRIVREKKSRAEE